MSNSTHKDCERKLSQWQALIDKCNANRMLLYMYEKIGIYDMINDAVVHCRHTLELRELSKLVDFYEREIKKSLNVHVTLWIAEAAAIHVVIAGVGYWLIPMFLVFYYFFFVRMLH